MSPDKQRIQHRLWTIGLTVAVLLPVFALSFVVPLFVTELDAYQLLGFPAGFYLVAQGAILIFVVLLFSLMGSQEDVDRRLGAAEDN